VWSSVPSSGKGKCPPVSPQKKDTYFKITWSPGPHTLNSKGTISSVPIYFDYSRAAQSSGHSLSPLSLVDFKQDSLEPQCPEL
jgi:hypothetical protein